MAETTPKLLYVVVVDRRGNGNGDREETFRYTRPMLQSALQLMGCKARHAFKISKRVFEMIRVELSANALPLQNLKSDVLESAVGKRVDQKQAGYTENGVAAGCLGQENVETPHIMPFELYKRLTTVVVTRDKFLKVTCDTLSRYKYIGPNQREDLMLACRIRERKESVTVLLCGTSGCGKSTLSSLLGSRLGVTNVISTDSIRHMMRSFADEKQNPLLWASTYHAGDCLDPVAVAEAKAKRRAKKLAVISHSKAKEPHSDVASNEKLYTRPPGQVPRADFIGKKQMAIEGFKAQSEMVIDSLDRLITAWEDRKESVVVEGVHLSLNFVMGLMKKHPSIIPFMIYITNEDKHMERFAVRAKYMTLDPAKNKYVKYIRNIRTIQEYLCNRADKHLVPKVNNTNVDRSVAAIHATVFSCLRRREAGEHLYDSTTKTVSIVHEEYRNQCAANTLTSKGMFQLIQRKGSFRHLMALLNTDGTVAKAWPFDSVDGNGRPTWYNGSEKCVGSPMYGPLQIGKAEPVNLQFGNFGISAWRNDTGGTSRAGSIDGSRADGTETESRYFSSCCSSPKFSDGPAKELKEGISVSGSDEEADDSRDMDSDEDESDVDKKEIHDELEGSVDEDSTKSDEEYDDLAMRDGQENDYWTDNDDELANKTMPTSCVKLAQNDSAPGTTMDDGDKYQQNLDLFLKLSNRFAESSRLSNKEENIAVDMRMRTRSFSDSSQIYSHLSIPASGEPVSIFREPILQAALRL